MLPKAVTGTELLKRPVVLNSTILYGMFRTSTRSLGRKAFTTFGQGWTVTGKALGRCLFPVRVRAPSMFFEDGRLALCKLENQTAETLQNMQCAIFQRAKTLAQKRTHRNTSLRFSTSLNSNALKSLQQTFSKTETNAP